MKFYFFLLLIFGSITACHASIFQEQLYQDLLYNYFKVVRPVQNFSDKVEVEFGAKLIRIIELDEKSQVLITNLWLDLRWKDPKLSWSPDEYDGIKKVHIPVEHIWLPDILLYTNAMGDPQITIFTDATVYYDGQIVWQPPAIYKSFCDIDIKLFPYDKQLCKLKFGLWSYDEYVDVVHLREKDTKIIFDALGEPEVWCVHNAMDLDYFYESAEWDLLNITSARHEVIYTTCCGTTFYIDLTYDFHLRRKPLFFTINLVIPCVMIALLTTTVFYLSDHKMTFSISVLVTLSVFLNVLVDLLPPTSIVLPLIGKYVLFSMFLVTASIIIAVINLNFKHRSAATHGPVPNHMKKIFFLWLPPYICLLPFKAAKSLEQSQKKKKSFMMRIPKIRVVDEVLIDSLPSTPKSPSRSRSGTPKRRSSRPTTPKVEGAKFMLQRRNSPLDELKKMQDSPEFKRALLRQHATARPSKLQLRDQFSTQMSTDQSSFEEDTEYFERRSNSVGSKSSRHNRSIRTPSVPPVSHMPRTSADITGLKVHALRQRYIIGRMLDNVTFIADHFKMLDEEAAIADEWSYLSVVLDRIFLILFFILNTGGTFFIWAPAFQSSWSVEPLHRWSAADKTPLGHFTLGGNYT